MSGSNEFSFDKLDRKRKLPTVAILAGMTGDHLHGAQVGIEAVWKTTTTEDQSYIIQLFSNAGGRWR